MTAQASLFVPPRVDNALRVYRNVYVIDGVYHRPWSNMNEPDRNGRNEVIGTVMRCGIHRRFTTPWSWPAESIPVEVAHQTAEPCDRCFR